MLFPYASQLPLITNSVIYSRYPQCIVAPDEWIESTKRVKPLFWLSPQYNSHASTMGSDMFESSMNYLLLYCYTIYAGISVGLSTFMYNSMFYYVINYYVITNHVIL